MTFTPEQVAELGKPLDHNNVATRSQSGRSLSYIEGWHAIAEANRIFGFDGWSRETVEMREVRPPELVKSSSGKETWRVGFIAKVRVSVDSVVREGTGYGSGALPDLGEAYESAVKEAETDACKRALMTFGNQFGLALYDKERANVTSEAKPAPRPAPKPAPSPVDVGAEEQARDRLIVRIKACTSVEQLDQIKSQRDFSLPWKALGDEAKVAVVKAGEARREELAGKPPLLMAG